MLLESNGSRPRKNLGNSSMDGRRFHRQTGQPRDREGISKVDFIKIDEVHINSPLACLFLDNDGVLRSKKS